MSKLGENLSEEDVNEMIQLADKDGYGKVNEEEFLKIMMSNDQKNIDNNTLQLVETWDWEQPLGWSCVIGCHRFRVGPPDNPGPTLHLLKVDPGLKSGQCKVGPCLLYTSPSPRDS